MRLDDFYHLPILSDSFARLVAARPGLTLIAGLDLPASAAGSTDTPLPSGRTTIFRILAEALLGELGGRAALVAEDAAAFRVPRAYRDQVSVLQVRRRQRYESQIRQALVRGARLLILDQLSRENAAHLLAATGTGVSALTQINSPARGLELIRELERLGVGWRRLPDQLWLVAVQRLPMLCAFCRRLEPLTPMQQLQLRLKPTLGLDPEGAYPIAAGCAHCQQRGRSGTLTLFDLGRLQRERDGQIAFEAILPMEQYARELVERGLLAFDDMLDFEGVLARQIFSQFTGNQQALLSANQTLERKLAELHSANQVLQQRTTALLSFQAVGQALISSTDLRDLAHRVCHHVRDLCGADLAALYILDGAEQAEILAVSGWAEGFVGRRVAAAPLLTEAGEPSAFAGWPPGVPPQHADLMGGTLRAGLCAPLIAEQRQVGMLILHTMRRARFAPGETALLQTFAHQAALLIQRTHLIDTLNAHIVQLQAAQAAIVERQRLAREMELAAEVQRDILPHIFPQVPGLSFAAHNRPAREVGGDFYDVFTLDERTVGVVIADVSGKGMPAALYMALTRSLLLAEARRERSPKTVLLNVNRLLREVGDPHMFVTVFYGIIDTASHMLTYARAGHDYPLLLRGEAVEQLTAAGLVLGMLDVTADQLGEQQLALHDGDRLLLYTDGLIDVVNEENQRLELPGLLAMLQRQRCEAPEALCAETFAALAAYQGAAEQFDDMTLVVVGVEAPCQEVHR